MSVHRCCVAVVMLIAAAAAQSSPCAAPAHAERDVRALEQKWLANLENADVVATILADDFQHVVPQGIINRAQHLDFVRTHPHFAAADRRFERLDVRVYGTAAVATGVVASVRDGQPQRSLFTDVFAFRNGRWQAVSAQERLQPPPPPRP